MDDYQNLNHTKWECKYHVVFIPKCRRKTLYGALRRCLGAAFRQLTEQKECRVEEGHLMPDHLHMMPDGCGSSPSRGNAQEIDYLTRLMRGFGAGIGSGTLAS